MNFDIPDLEQVAFPFDGVWIFAIILIMSFTLVASFFYGELFSRKTSRALYVSTVIAMLGLGGVLAAIIPPYAEADWQVEAARQEQRDAWASQFISETERLYNVTISEKVAWELLEGWEFKPENFNDGLDIGTYWESDHPVSLFHEGAHIQAELAWLGDQFALVHHDPDPAGEVRELERADK